jgi:hypothetical protein
MKTTLSLFVTLMFMAPSLSFAKTIVVCSERSVHDNITAYVEMSPNKQSLKARVTMNDMDAGKDRTVVRRLSVKAVTLPEGMAYANERAGFQLSLFAAPRNAPNADLVFGKGARRMQVRLYCKQN